MEGAILEAVILLAKVVGLAIAWVGLFTASCVAAILTMVLLPPIMTLLTLVKTLSPKRVLYALALTPTTGLVLAYHFVTGKKQADPLKPSGKQWYLVYSFSALYWIGFGFLVIRAFSPSLGPILF